ncbi:MULTISPECIES: M48 family metallopeptidase [Halomonas]|uniref:M48 family metallopeptidase n=1 Tax=Halomonas TaxID=2745 RepID=UPI003CEB269C
MAWQGGVVMETPADNVDVPRQQRLLNRWRLLIPLVHWTGTLLALAVGIASVVTLPILLVQQAWHWLHYLWSLLPNAMVILPIPYPPTIGEAVVLSGHIMRYAMLCVGILHVLVPASRRLLRQSGLTIKPLPKEHSAQVYVTTLCKAHRIRAARVYVTHTNAILAYAVAAPLRRPAIVISDGLLVQAPADISRWVLAHEVAHLYHGDCRRSSLWIVAMDALLHLDRIRVTITRLLLRAISLVPLLNRLLVPLLGRPLCWVTYVLGGLGRLGYRLSTVTYKVADRWVSRRCEYRADVFAATQEGVDPGIRLMTALKGSFEPQFDIMATHPEPAQRIATLQRLAPVPTPHH